MAWALLDRRRMVGLGASLWLGVLAGCVTAPEAPRAGERAMAQGVSTFLMFEGQAEEAMGFYVSLFEDAQVRSLERYGPGEGGAEGSVKLATFALAGHELMCIDSPAPHEFTFTPAISLFVTCRTEAEIDELFAKLSQDGQVLMPLAAYPFSRKFAWLADRYGVSWQLSLPLESAGTW